MQIAAHRRTTTSTATGLPAGNNLVQEVRNLEISFPAQGLGRIRPEAVAIILQLQVRHRPSSSITLPLLPPRPRRRVHRESPQLFPLFPPLIRTRSRVLPSLPTPWSLPPRHGQSSRSGPSFDAAGPRTLDLAPPNLVGLPHASLPLLRLDPSVGSRLSPFSGVGGRRWPAAPGEVGRVGAWQEAAGGAR